MHLRLTGVFAGVALVPTILVAVFAIITVNFGLEGWFSERVRSVVGTSLSAAEAYEAEHRQDLVSDAEKLAADLNLQKQFQPVCKSYKAIFSHIPGKSLKSDQKMIAYDQIESHNFHTDRYIQALILTLSIATDHKT